MEAPYWDVANTRILRPNWQLIGEESRFHLKPLGWGLERYRLVSPLKANW